MLPTSMRSPVQLSRSPQKHLGASWRCLGHGCGRPRPAHVGRSPPGNRRGSPDRTRDGRRDAQRWRLAHAPYTADDRSRTRLEAAGGAPLRDRGVLVAFDPPGAPNQAALERLDGRLDSHACAMLDPNENVHYMDVLGNDLDTADVQDRLQLSTDEVTTLQTALTRGLRALNADSPREERTITAPVDQTMLDQPSTALRHPGLSQPDSTHTQQPSSLTQELPSLATPTGPQTPHRAGTGTSPTRIGDALARVQPPPHPFPLEGKNPTKEDPRQ